MVDLCAFLGAAIPEIHTKGYETRTSRMCRTLASRIKYNDSHEVNPMDVIEPVVREMAIEHG